MAISRLIQKLILNSRFIVFLLLHRPEADLYSFNLQDPIPVFNLPLQPEDAPITIDLTHLIQEVYEQGCFDLQVNYQSTLPDLSAADLDWVKQMVDRSSAYD